MRTQAAFDEGIGKDVLMTLYDSMVESYAPKSAAPDGLEPAVRLRDRTARDASDLR